MSTTQLQGEWKQDQCGGYLRPYNPQFLLSVKKNVKVTILLSRLGNPSVCGIIFGVYTSPDGNRLHELPKEVYKSKYYASNQVSGSVNLKKDILYIIVPCLQHANVHGQFTLSITASPGSIQNFYELPPFKTHTLHGEWNGELKTGGYCSLNNPQYELLISRRGTISIILERTDDGPTEGMLFMIVKGLNNRNIRKKTLGSDDLIFKSPYLTSKKISAKIDLDVMPIPYIIVPCLQHAKHTGKFKLTVQASDPVTLEEIEERLEKKREEDCSHILSKYQKIKNLYIHNPIEEIIQYCKDHDCNFIDNDFPPNEKSLNRDYSKNVIVKCDNWMRCSEFLDSPELFKDGISVEDLIQGSIGDCWFCEAIAACATRPELIKRLFFPQMNSEYGVYSIKIFVDGEWRYSIIDDYIPLKNGKAHFAHSSDPNELWVMLLEKAFAKYLGSYQDLDGKNPAIALEALSGGHVDYIQTNKLDKTELWNRIMKHVAENWIMGASTGGTSDTLINSMGIVQNHAYTVIDAKEIKNLRLLHIRNTWGHTEWKGDWSDYSPLWTDELKKECGWKLADDGTFWMSYDDFLQHFPHLYLCKIVEEKYPYHYIVIGEWTPGCSGGYRYWDNPQVDIYISTPTKILIDLKRSDDKNDQGLIAFIACEEGKNKRNGYIKELIAKSNYLKSSSVRLAVDLVSNTLPYTIIPCLQNSRTAGPWKIIIRSDQKINITAVKNCNLKEIEGVSQIPKITTDSDDTPDEMTNEKQITIEEKINSVVKNDQIMEKKALRIQNMYFGNGHWVAILHPANESVTEECYSATNIKQLWSQIASSYNQGRRIHQITYGDNTFHLIMRDGKEQEQCVVGSSLSDLWKQVVIQYKRKMRCHTITYGNDTWIAVMKRKKPIVAEQCVIANSISDLWEKVNEQRNQKKGIHHITYALNTWVAIMKEGLLDEQYIVANSLFELFQKIEEQHKEGRKIYSLCFGENVWVAVAKKDQEHSDVKEHFVSVTSLPELWNRVQNYYDGSFG